MEIQPVNLKDFSSLKIGGLGSLVYIQNDKELLEAIDFAKKNNLQIKVIGQGTNSYFGNDLEKYLFLKFVPITPRGGINTGTEFLKIPAGVIFDEAINFSMENNLFGLENLSAIPGTVGAAIVQNIGAYGVELSDIFYSARVYDLQKNIFLELKKEDCNFSYRESIFKIEKDRFIILDLTLKLSKNFQPNLFYESLQKLQKDFDTGILTAKVLREKIIQIRAEKLPDYHLYPNAGSFFKNVILSSVEAVKGFPAIKITEYQDGYKISTGGLIEFAAQMKGFRKNNFGISERQALTLINYNGLGKLKELQDFVQEIKNKVFEKTGIIIEEEVNLIT